MQPTIPAAGLLALALAIPALADEQYSPADLGGTLTRFGAIAAGNAEGTIPPYDGGLKVPAGLVPGDGFWPDPFADEKPRLRITAANAGQYADQLSAGQMRLLKQNPDSYFMDIYPTHRTAAFPRRFSPRPSATPAIPSASRSTMASPSPKPAVAVCRSRCRAMASR